MKKMNPAGSITRETVQIEPILLILPYICLLFRFLTIVFAVSVPLIEKEIPGIINSVSSLGFASVFFTLLIIFSSVFRVITLKYLYIWNCASVLAVLFAFGTRQFGLAPMFFICAIFLGVSLAGNEMLNLTLATHRKKDMTLNMTRYNYYRVLGIAAGFLLGCFVASNTTMESLSMFFISVACLMISILSIGYLAKISGSAFLQQGDAGSDVMQKVIKFFSEKGYLPVLFIIDVGIFSFWYSYIPYRLSSALISEIDIGIFLTVQAFVHALSQWIWRIIIFYIGAAKSY